MSGKRLVLTQRDRDLLRFLADKKAAPTDVLARRFFATNPQTGAASKDPLRACQRRMDALRAAGHLRTAPIPKEAPIGEVTPQLYYLSESSAKKYGGSATPVHPRHLHHHVVSIRACETYASDLRAQGARNVEYKLEHELIRDDYRASTPQQGRAHVGYADAIIQLEAPNDVVSINAKAEAVEWRADAGWDKARVDFKELEVHGGGHAKAEADLLRVEADGRTQRVGNDIGHIEAGGKAEGYVGADAKVDAKGVVSAKNLDAGVNADASAFIGAKAVAGGDIDLGVRGHNVVNLRGVLEGYAGAGINGHAVLQFKDGKLSIEYGGGAAWGLGYGAKGGLDVDVQGIANVVLNRPADDPLTIGELLGIDSGAEGGAQAPPPAFTSQTVAVEYVTCKYSEEQISTKSESLNNQYDNVLWIADNPQTQARVERLTGQSCATVPQ